MARNLLSKNSWPVDLFKRPAEVDSLIGDYSKAKQVLTWQPTTFAPELARLMTLDAGKRMNGQSC